MATHTLLIIWLCAISHNNWDAIPASNTSPEKDIIGVTVSDLHDSTLLNLVYGSCYLRGENYCFNKGPQIWNENDSIYMKVEEGFGNDSLQIIYIRGEMAITSTMHNSFNETSLAFWKVQNGWKVIDARIDEEIIDYSAIEPVREFHSNILINYKTFGVYAGGIEYGENTYSLISSKGFNGPSVSFISTSANIASIECVPEEDKECDCYSREGKVSINYNPIWKCLTFDYDYTNSTGGCSLENPQTFIYRQTWFMNNDTCLLVAGNPIEDFGQIIKDEIKLSDAEIAKYMLPK